VAQPEILKGGGFKLRHCKRRDRDVKGVKGNGVWAPTGEGFGEGAMPHPQKILFFLLLKRPTLVKFEWFN